MKKELLIIKRKKARELHKQGWSNRKIARHLVSSKDSIGKWINMTEEEVLTDNRGWKKGKLRKYTKKDRERVIQIREELEKEGSFFIGSKVIKYNYEKQLNKKITESFINRTLKEAKLSKSHEKRKKGASKYMNYPQITLNKLGKIMMSIDFIGPKYLKGSDNRINFLSCKYIRPEKEGMVKRIEGQTTRETMRILKEIWKEHPIPDVLKVDNDSAFGANLSHEMSVGKLTLFLLNLGVSPLYIAVRSPWNNGHVEGHNSVFSRKFWNKLRFTDEEEIDIEIKKFNMDYKKYSKLISNNPKLEDLNIKHISDFKEVDLENREVRKFKSKKIYFLRIVRRKGQKGSAEEHGFINILKREIRLPKDLINLFVFSVLDLKSKELLIQTEKDDGSLKRINRMKFLIKNIRY